MALKAERIDVGSVQKSWIGSSVRCVARHAALGFDYPMLVNPRPRGFRMALGADCVLLRGSPEVLPIEGAMWVVAVGTLDQAFFHLVMERHVERRLRIGVALEAELRLRNLEELLGVFAGMNAVAADAAHI